MRLGNALTAMSATHAPKTEPQRKKRTCTKKCSAGVRLANHAGSSVKSSWLAKMAKTTARENRAMTTSQRYLPFAALLSLTNGSLRAGASPRCRGWGRVSPRPPSKLCRAEDPTTSRTGGRHTPRYGWVATLVSLVCIFLRSQIQSHGGARTSPAWMSHMKPDSAGAARCRPSRTSRD
jgi:hypothetical protein